MGHLWLSFLFQEVFFFDKKVKTWKFVEKFTNILVDADFFHQKFKFFTFLRKEITSWKNKDSHRKPNFSRQNLSSFKLKRLFCSRKISKSKWRVSGLSEKIFYIRAHQIQKMLHFLIRSVSSLKNKINFIQLNWAIFGYLSFFKKFFFSIKK